MHCTEKDLELVKFVLTPDMSLELINFNNLKKELFKLKEMYNLDKNDDKLLLKIQEIQEKLDESRDRFVQDFRKNNKEEIDKYLEIKNQDLIWFFFLFNILNKFNIKLLFLKIKKEIRNFCRIIYMRVKRNSSFVETV